MLSALSETMTQSAVIVADTTDMPREEWLELRREGIGGSDAAALLGMSSYGSPLTVWMEKTGRHVDTAENDYTRWGNLLEPIIRGELPQYWLDTTGDTIGVVEYPFMLQSMAYPFMTANVDGLCVRGSEAGGLEVKTATVMQASNWRDGEVPDAYYCQVQHYMAVTGLPWFVVAVLIGKSLTHRIVPRNDEFIEELVEVERAFWEDHVEADVMPLPFGIDAEGTYLDALGAGIGEAELHVEGLEDLILLYDEAKEDEKAAGEEKRRLYHQIKRMMLQAGGLDEDHDTGKIVAVDGNARATWSFFDVQRFDSSKYKKDHPKQYARYSKKSTQSRLTVKVKETK